MSEERRSYGFQVCSDSRTDNCPFVFGARLLGKRAEYGGPFKRLSRVLASTASKGEPLPAGTLSQSLAIAPRRRILEGLTSYCYCKMLRDEYNTIKIKNEILKIKDTNQNSKSAKFNIFDFCFLIFSLNEVNRAGTETKNVTETSRR